MHISARGRRIITPGFAVCLALWGALFWNLNSGPWLVQDVSTLSGLATFVRVYATVPVLLIAIVILMASPRFKLGSSPVGLLILYGVVSFAAGLVGSPDPAWATYWAVAFLAAVSTAAATMSSLSSPFAIGHLVRGTWIATVAVLAIIVYRAPNSIFHAKTGYSIYLELQNGVISSGVARWAAVAALGGLVRAITCKALLSRVLSATVSVFGLWVVYRMQSRGAVFGALAALLFLACLHRRLRVLSFGMLLVVIALMFTSEDSRGMNSSAKAAVWSYLKRGGSDENVWTMSGRTSVYARVWEAFETAPLLGRGQWADRLQGITHAHNTYLQALLNAGIIGFVPFALSWAIGWRLFSRTWANRVHLSPEQRHILLECGLVMAFFTLRSIPETTTASYSPDLLIMCANYCYLQSVLPVTQSIATRRRAYAVGQYSFDGAPYSGSLSESVSGERRMVRRW